MNTFHHVTARLIMVAALVASITTITSAQNSPIFWKAVNIPARDTFTGPGGRSRMPDLSRITFIKEEKGGYSKKYRIKDGSDNVWVAKIGKEAQSETAAVRLLWAIGYPTEINYLVDRLTIPGKGTFSNVRLEARPRGVDRGKEWRWDGTPFEKTRQMQALKLMMAFINNWDMKNANNIILTESGVNHYVISDLGVSFGKTGSNSLPLFWIIGRTRNKPADYASSKFITGVKGDRVKVHFNGKNRGLMRDIRIADARWLADLLVQLSDKQIRDAFRAANYSQSDVNLLTREVKERIYELDRIGDARIANRR